MPAGARLQPRRQWSWIDGNMIRSRKIAKNKKDRSFPIVGTLMDVIERRQKLRRLDCPYVFHRNGKPIRSFRKAFKAAAKEVGHDGLLPHDMRRSAIRNFRRSGLSESDGMNFRDTERAASIIGTTSSTIGT
jgi:integrase